MSRWLKAAHLAEVVSPGRVALLDLSDLDSAPMVLTDSAAVIWAELGEERDVADVVAAVAGLYGVAEDQVRRDIEAFIADLAARGLLVEAALAR